jgi:creatinine amidohydrolase
LYWQELTSKGFSERAIGHADTVLIPIGSVEAHGLHLPLGADNLAPEAICRRLEQRYPDRIMVAPTIAYGHTWSLERWPGTLSLSSRLVADYATEVGQAMAAWGMRQIVFVNGHGGNVGPLTEAMERIAERSARVCLINWWLDFSHDILTVVEGQGHAGEDETSVMLALHGEWVTMADAQFNPYRLRFSRIRAEDILEKQLRHAMTGDARAATREKGEAILALVDQRAAQILEDLWADRLFDERRD